MGIESAIMKILKESSLSNKKENKLSNIILFSDVDKFPEPPYVVIKPETGTIENTRQYRIIAHHKKGFFDELNDYVLVELDSLLLNKNITDDEGNRYKLNPLGFTDIMPEPADNTYFMERLYYTPITVR